MINKKTVIIAVLVLSGIFVLAKGYQYSGNDNYKPKYQKALSAHVIRIEEKQCPALVRCGGGKIMTIEYKISDSFAPCQLQHTYYIGESHSVGESLDNVYYDQNNPCAATLRD